MDGWLPVFSGVDPISSDFPHLSPYNYASNDPVLNIDLHGLQGVSGTGALYYSTKLYGQKGYDDYMTAQSASAGAYSVLSPVDEVSVGLGLLGRTTVGRAAMGFASKAMGKVGSLFSKAVPASFKEVADKAMSKKEMAKKVGGTRRFRGFTDGESDVINEGLEILKSSEMKNLVNASKKGEFLEVDINGRTIGFEPGFPQGQGYRAMTDVERNGWTFASDAFESVEELTKTIFHELHRLNFSDVAKTGSANVNNAASSTKGAAEFADKVWDSINQ